MVKATADMRVFWPCKVLLSHRSCLPAISTRLAGQIKDRKRKHASLALLHFANLAFDVLSVPAVNLIGHNIRFRMLYFRLNSSRQARLGLKAVASQCLFCHQLQASSRWVLERMRVLELGVRFIVLLEQ